jgi:hypothetical protein
MPRVLPQPRRLLPILGALTLVAASWPTVAVFSAPAEGADLTPVGEAHRMIEILQGNRTVLWSSLAGPVSMVETRGWPVSVDGNELGGAVVIDDVDGEISGVVDFGEKPRTLTFDR